MSEALERGRYVEWAELRQVALALAIDSVDKTNGEAEETLPRAGLFLKFLTGDTEGANS